MLICVDSMHYVYGFECWTGIHIIHAAFAILISVIFANLCVVLSLTYFKTLMSSADVSARINPRGDFFLLTEKLIMAVAFAFLR